MTGIELSEITASFGGERVLGPLSFAVTPGEQVALVGKSGAGKSTLMRLIYQQSNGGATLIPQDLGLVHALPVFHNVYMAQLNRHPTWYNVCTLVRPFQRERREIMPLLEQLGINEKQWAPVASLSGGQRQRVAIARALYRNSGMLLADEPVSALDGPMAHTVMALLQESYQTSIVALHDIELALRYSHRIIGIQDGRIALDEPSARLSEADILPLY
ncbi:ATP-binding cassette domain-containing protein [Marinobacter caseinilyticus]|uniref:ATP-binding cassette domain-containing protein n=1 Tax=Marinobacter caseinilyticus TaxID=2692195 RepID=UPI00140B1C88|nr:ATP-binding cassette domain-containing protein [Marinobacter caseinilyticus]